MSFLLASELDEFRDNLRSLLSANVPSAGSRAAAAPSSDLPSLKVDSVWSSLVEQGVFLAPVPEMNGGLGFGAAAAAMICEETGYALVSSPVLETFAFGVFPLLHSAEPARVEQFFDGSVCATGSISPEFVSEGVIGSGDGLFPNVHRESVVIIPCEYDGEPFARVCTLGPDAVAGLSWQRPGVVDLTRQVSAIALNSILDVANSDRLEVVEPRKLRAVKLLLVSAEMLGAARKLLEMTVEYAKTRKQFGAAIGSFQAIQHRLADMTATVESVGAMLRFTAWSIDHDPAQFHRAALSLKSHASTALLKLAEDALQIHGGIGFTFEYELHFYLRRIASLGLWFGSSSTLWRELGEEEVRVRSNSPR